MIMTGNGIPLSFLEKKNVCRDGEAKRAPIPEGRRFRVQTGAAVIGLISFRQKIDG